MAITFDLCDLLDLEAAGFDSLSPRLELLYAEALMEEEEEEEEEDDSLAGSLFFRGNDCVPSEDTITPECALIDVNDDDFLCCAHLPHLEGFLF